MADVDAYGCLVGAQGQIVPLLNTAQSEGSTEATQTDSNFVGSVMTAGTYASQLAPRFTLRAGGVVAENEISNCYILSAGRIKASLAVGSSGVGGDDLPYPLPYPVQLVPGDEVYTDAQTAASRVVGLAVACTNGEYHNFEATAATGEVELVSCLTGLSIGETLQNRIVSHAMACGGDNNDHFSSPIYILNGSGIPEGAILPTDLSSSSAVWTRMNCRIQLNSRAVVRCDS